LTSLLRGLGVAASYEVLRDLCATDVDGTSIDAVESVAVAAGVVCQQTVVPVEHVTALPMEYLPAVAVTLLPDGFTHFVVLWRVRGRKVLIMDPAQGRRWVRVADLHDELLRHEVAVPAEGWREWAGSEVFRAALWRRLTALRISTAEAARLLDEACADPAPAGLAALDAAIRLLEAHGENGPYALAKARAGLNWHAATGPQWSCRPGPEGTARLRGAVIVRVQDMDPAGADQKLLARLDKVEPTPVRVLAGLLDRPSLLAGAVVAGALVMAGLAVAEEVVLRPLVEPSRSAQDRHLLTAIAVAAAAGVTAVLATLLALQAGRRTELAVRMRWWSAVAALPDEFIRTRPLSDMAERGHLLHRIRELPMGILRVGYGVGTAVGGTAVIAVVASEAWLWMCAMLIVSAAGPLLLVRRVIEADLRVRTLSGSLARFYQDAVLGADTLRAAGAGARLALTYEHDRSLGAWEHAQRRLLLLTVGARAVTSALGAAAVVGATLMVQGGVETILLVALMGVLVVEGGALVADAMRTVPVSRSTVARAVGALQAASDGAPSGPAESGSAPAPAPELVLVGVSVVTRDVRQLDNLHLAIPAGAHVAVLGASGAGKSSLLAALLGWAELTSGRILVDGHPHDPAALRRRSAWITPETRLWNDTLEVNARYGAAPDAADVEERLRMAEAGHLPAQLGRRPDARLGDGGAALSDGEAARVRLARGLGRPGAPVVLLDEPFRGLDHACRQRLMTTVRTHWAAATLVCAVHDVSDTADFDLVAVLAQGRLVEYGPPPQLAAKAGSAYSALLAAAPWDLDASWSHLQLHAPP
jgi:ATP-binding cassette subfamily B protein